ncbi:carbohydrate kinase family protein [Hoeflea sp. WL0058]|uniref:Carbohydrate kinase family protein n=1 Tax=Flavimaribacter sediminis TaxID=2865987 RepID=A0AAE2ZKR1_9HYPH|nr:carbohydrate kinase family protein [Flavimaribacter sediminis]MBW8636462.1 carbohydrate kinase family protein [Flavimaribacter sediminis]
MARIFVLGGAHLDRRAQISTRTIPGASNPGRWREEPGGGGFNAARNLAQLGNTVTMVSVGGGDAAAEAVERRAADAGVDFRQQIFLDRTTPSYSAILEQDGNLLIAVADMELYDRFGPRQFSRRHIREAVEASEWILCDANFQTASLAALVSAAAQNGKPVAAIAISPAKVVRLAPLLDQLSVLFLNEAEARELCGPDSDADAWPDALRERGLRCAVITRGARPVIAFDGERAFSVETREADGLADVTGAGDALAAATLDGLARGLELAEAVRSGVAAAWITVRSAEAVATALDGPALNAATAGIAPATIFNRQTTGYPA